MKLIIDVHTHVNFAPYNRDREHVIKKAQEAGVKMICVGIDAKTSESAIALAEKYPNDIWATVGCHPHYAGEKGKCDIEVLKKLAKHPKVVAIGECGFDYYRFKIQDLRFKNKQNEIFKQQIELATKIKKPLMIHCRSSVGTDDACDDALNTLNANRYTLNAIMHFYAGSLVMAKKLLDRGFYFTFGGVITFPPKAGQPRADSYDETIKFLPIENIMLETDAPYVAPEPYRGKRNEPAYIVETAKKLAEIKNLDYDKVLEITTANAKKVFGIMNHEL